MTNLQEMILNTPSGSHFMTDMISRFVEITKRPACMLNQYYSQMLEKDLNMNQTWALIEAQTAFFLGVLPVGYAFTLRAAALIWLILAVRKCRRLLS